MARSKTDPDDDGNESRGELYEMLASESEARAAAVLPTKPSEDMSHLLGKLIPPGAKRVEEDEREYTPSEKVEWVVTVEFAGKPRLDPRKANDLFDTRWRKKYGPFMMFGRDAQTGLWTFAVSADGPKAVTQLKLAWDYASDLDESGPPSAELFEQRLAEVTKKVKKLGEARVSASLPPDEAEERAAQLEEVKALGDESAVLVLKAPKGKRFDGKDIWDAMLCLGLRWGDMDCFHWQNPSEEGDDSLFVVETSTPPGYFLPEQIAAGRLQVNDLVFGFSVPRSVAPLKVFEGMSKAVEYCQKRLGGEVVDEEGAKASLPTIKKRIAEVERELRAAGFEPGKDETLQLF